MILRCSAFMAKILGVVPHEPPPGGTIAVCHKNQIFIWATDNTYWIWDHIEGVKSNG